MNRLFTIMALCLASLSVSAADRLITSKAPTGIELKHDFEVKARTTGGEWQSIDTYAFKVDRVANAKHNVELTSVAKFEFDGKKCEFTSFRKERYADGGGHTPEFTEPTDDIYEDARRRDFKCNAVYYDVTEGEFIDPLGGIEDIKNKILDTVKTPDDVFKSDGLRLMRLARFTGELGFTPTEEVIESAKKYSGNLKDIVRVLQEKNPSVRVVINAISLETVSEVMELVEEGLLPDAEILQVSAARSKVLGRYHMMMGQNPVYIISAGGNKRSAV